MASLDELRADLLRRLAKFLPMEESSAAATSSLSTTSSTERTAAAPLAPIATTTPKLVSHPVLEQQMTKPSSSLVFSAGQVVGDGRPRADAVFASALPTRCSTICSTVNVGSNHAAVAFPTSGTELRVDDQLTHIGGLSLFLELDLDSANKVFEEDVFTTVGGISLFLDLNMEFEVLTCVGDCSIFLQPSMGDPTEVFDTPPTVDMDKVLDHGLGVPLKGCKLQQLLSQEMQQHGTNCDTHVLPWDPGQQKVGIKSLFGWRHHADKCVMQCSLCVDSRSVTDVNALHSVTHPVLDKIPPWERGGFSPGDCATEDDHFEFIKLPAWTRSDFCPGNYGMGSEVCAFEEVSPWRRNALSPGHSVIQTDHLLLEGIQPWRRNAFSPGKSTLRNPKEQKWARGDLQIENMLTAIILQFFNFVSQLQITQLPTRNWNLGILNIILMLGTPMMISTQGFIQFVHKSWTCLILFHVVFLGNLRMLQTCLSHNKWCNTQTTVQKFSHELFIFSQRLPMSATPIQAKEITDKYYHPVQSDDTAQLNCCVLHHTLFSCSQFDNVAFCSFSHVQRNKSTMRNRNNYGQDYHSLNQMVVLGDIKIGQDLLLSNIC